MTPGTLSGQVALVTGAGRGLGTDIARALAAEGARVALVGRTPGPLEELADSLPDAVALPTDVRDPAAVARLVQAVGPVDLLVNNAAAIESSERQFWQADPDELWDVVETNLRGPMLLSRAVLPGMVSRGGGRVVNVTSRARAASQTGTYTAYAVSKRALSVLTEALAAPLRGTGVVVLDVLPGLVRTPMTDAMPVWRGVPPEGWDPASATASLVVEVALGRYDAAAGTVLDAPAIARDGYGTISP